MMEYPHSLSDEHDSILCQTSILHDKHLTPRQQEVTRLVTSGCTNKQIATQLNCSPKTVSHHITSITGKARSVYNRDTVSRKDIIRYFQLYYLFQDGALRPVQNHTPDDPSTFVPRTPRYTQEVMKLI